MTDVPRSDLRLSRPEAARTPLRVRVSVELGHRGFARICPGGETAAGVCATGGCVFHVNPTERTAADFWIVFGAAGPREVAEVDPRNTLFVSCEPPSKKIYPRRYYAQFHRVKSYRLQDPHPRVSIADTGLNWYAGLSFPGNRYEVSHPDLVAMNAGPKQDKVSVICSNTATTPGQKLRLTFLDQMKRHFGDRMVHFGKGFTPVGDKLEAIAPYAYHLVLENDRHPNYWSEKLSDAYLGRAFPFYVGCPNLGEFFPEDGFLPVDPTRPDAAVALMEAAMTAGRAAASAAEVERCRGLVLNDYNPFVRMAAWVQEMFVPATPRTITVRSHRAFRRFPQDLAFRLKTRGSGSREPTRRGGKKRGPRGLRKAVEACRSTRWARPERPAEANQPSFSGSAAFSPR